MVTLRYVTLSLRYISFHFVTLHYRFVAILCVLDVLHCIALQMKISKKTNEYLFLEFLNDPLLGV